MPWLGWEALLRQRGVHYETRGSNVGRDEIAVRCPFCGDSSEHMGISLAGRGWSCLRCHRGGKSRSYLIQHLLGCSDDEARRLAGYEDEHQSRTEDDLATVLARLGAAPPADSRRLEMPRELRSLRDGKRAGPFLDYLRDRGYDGAELDWVVDTYDLRYATTGPFAWRLVVPVRDRRGRLLTWTGRAISPHVERRYNTLSADPEKAAYGCTALRAPSQVVMGMDVMWRAPDLRAVVVCEGPMDALRLSAFGRTLGVRAAPMLGLNLGEDFVAEMEALRDRFPAARFWLCTDAGAEMRRTQLLAALSTVGARPLTLPPDLEDPGAADPSQAVDLCLRALGD